MIRVKQNQFGRRNLPPFVRAELALALEPLFESKAKENQKLSNGAGNKGSQISANLKIDTRQELAKVAGVSHDTIYKARIITEKASKPVKEELPELYHGNGSQFSLPVGWFKLNVNSYLVEPPFFMITSKACPYE